MISSKESEAKFFIKTSVFPLYKKFTVSLSCFKFLMFSKSGSLLTFLSEMRFTPVYERFCTSSVKRSFPSRIIAAVLQYFEISERICEDKNTVANSFHLIYTVYALAIVWTKDGVCCF